MSEAPPELHLNPAQERRWFRTWNLAIILLFVVCGSILCGILWQTKRTQRLQQHQVMEATVPDPGVTAADTTGPTGAPVKVGLYLERIPELSVKDMTWTAVFDVWFRWTGADLNPAAAMVVMEGSIESKEKLAEVQEGGEHYERYRVVAKITKVFPVLRFPLDEHLLTLAVENGELGRNRMLFVPDTESSSISSRVAVPGYHIAGWSILEKPHSYKSTRGDPRLAPGSKSTHSQLRMGIFLERGNWGLYLKMFQGLFIAVVISLLAFFIKPTDLDPRFGLGLGALFAAVANSYLVGTFVPDTGELTMADLVNMIGIFTILVTLVESTVSLYLYDHRDEKALSRRLDQVSFKLILAGFVLLNVVLAIAAGL